MQTVRRTKWKVLQAPMLATLMILTLTSEWGFAFRSSYNLSHPLTWMHQLPTGEMPGWSQSSWFSWKLSHSNVWNAPLDFQRHGSGDTLEFIADYEQTSNIFEIGHAFSDSWAFSLEVPVAYRSGGVVDHFIDNFHLFIGSERYNRPFYDENRSEFRVRVNGEDKFKSSSVSGVGSSKLKLKWWPVQWSNENSGGCQCGLGSSLQVKVPLQSASPLSSGQMDISATANIGIPLGNRSGVWWTSALTYMPTNPLLKEWPTNRWMQTHELSTQIALSPHYSLILNLRSESPFMDRKKLFISDPTSTETERVLNRASSAWSALVHWRGSQSFGLQYHFQTPEDTLRFLFIEDWGLGSQNGQGQSLYVNNAPDVVFFTQMSLNF